MVGTGLIKVITGWFVQVVMALPVLDSTLVLFGGLWGILACMGLQAGAQYVEAFQHP